MGRTMDSKDEVGSLVVLVVGLPVVVPEVPVVMVELAEVPVVAWDAVKQEAVLGVAPVVAPKFGLKVALVAFVELPKVGLCY